MTARKKSANVEMTYLGVNGLWHWYWTLKAQLAPPDVVGLDQLVALWNWLMSNDVIRGLAPAVVAIWALLALVDSVIGAFHRGSTGAVVQLPTETVLTGEQLRAELDRLGKSQGDLAAELGVDRSYVSHLIRGKRPFLPNLQQQCRAIIDRWGCDSSD
jgi:hypothetical protein